jgi:hypothetical protein
MVHFTAYLIRKSHSIYGPLSGSKNFILAAPRLVPRLFIYGLHASHLIKDIIESKLQGDKAPTDDETAEIAGCSARSVRSNLLHFGSTKAPSNKGWAPRGKRPRQVERFHRGQRFQILPAYTEDGVLHFRVYKGSCTSRS